MTFPQQKVKVLPAMLRLTIQAKTHSAMNKASHVDLPFTRNCFLQRSQRLRFRPGSSSCSFVRSEDWHFSAGFLGEDLSVKKIQAA